MGQDFLDRQYHYCIQVESSQTFCIKHTFCIKYILGKGSPHVFLYFLVIRILIKRCLAKLIIE